MPSRYAEYIAYLESPEWRSWKAKKLRKPRARCWCCAIPATKARLELHHMTYKTFRNERSRDLVLLCRGCHRAVHAYQKEHGCSIRVATGRIRRPHRLAGKHRRPPRVRIRRPTRVYVPPEHLI